MPKRILSAHIAMGPQGIFQYSGIIPDSLTDEMILNSIEEGKPIKVPFTSDDIAKGREQGIIDGFVVVPTKNLLLVQIREESELAIAAQDKNKLQLHHH